MTGGWTKPAISLDAAAAMKPEVRTYLSSLPTAARRHLRTLRELIQAAAPDAVEAFSYGIPAFRLDDKPLVWYAAWKQHSSVYPISTALARAHGIDLSRFETSKGTVRFPLDRPPPSAVVRRLVKARITELRKKSTRSGGR